MNKKKFLILLSFLLAFLALFLLLKGIRLSFLEAAEHAAFPAAGSPVLSASDADSASATRGTRREVNIFLDNTGN